MAIEIGGRKIPIWLVVVGGVFVLGIIGSIFSGGGDEPSPIAETEQVEDAPVLEEETVEPEAPESFSDVAQLEQALQDLLGTQTNMDLDRELVVTLEDDGWLSVSYVLDENFSGRLTRVGGWGDIGEILNLAQKSDFVTELTVSAKFPLINNLGEELGPQDVMIVYFDAEVFPRVNTENLPGEMLSDAASSVFIHPALQD